MKLPISASGPILKVWKHLSYLGVDENEPFLERRRSIFLNRICIATIVLILPMMVPAINPATWMDTSVIVVFNIIILFTAAKGRRLIARYLFLILNTGGVYFTSVRSDYFQGEYLYFPLIIGVVPLIMNYEKKWNIWISSFIVFCFYLVFELSLDTASFHSYSVSPPIQFRLNFFYLMIGCWVISYLYLDLTNKQQVHLQEVNAQLLQNEEQLIKAKEVAEASAKAKTHFLSVMSHEIRTPLNTIIGLSELMKDKESTIDSHQNIELINFASNNLFSIVNDILDWSKIQSGKVKLEHLSFDLRDMVSKLSASAKLMCETKNVVFQMNLASGVPDWVMGDSTRITQIINNLLNNAIKFTTHGTVSFHVAGYTNGSNKAIINFNVTDTGIGMDAKQVAKIFDLFEQADETITRKFGGTGLGLAIAQKLTNLMGGEIRVLSIPGEGSTFSFELSLDLGNPVEEEEIFEHSDVLSGKRVLVVDDNQLNLVVAKNFLIRWGIEADTALSGNEALTKIKQKSFDLVLMDLSMPDMDGFETTLEIRRMGHLSLPIIALTASALISERGKVFSSGMNDLESKPFKSSSLYKKLVRHLS